MKASALNLFKKHDKLQAAKTDLEQPHSRFKAAPAAPVAKVPFKAMPSWWVVLWAYGLTAVFWHLAQLFFAWFPPYLLEVFKHLHGLPTSWADLGLYWAQRGLQWTALAAAVYHQLWQLGTRYRLTSHGIEVLNWFPLRRVLLVPYGSVKSAGFQQSPIGFILNYGHIEVDTNNPSGPLVFLNCPKPKLFLGILRAKMESALPSVSNHHKKADDS